MRDESPWGTLWTSIPSSSFLEYAFVRWVLVPALRPAIVDHLFPQAEVDIDSRRYRVDYEVRGKDRIFVIELDGFEFHGNWHAFNYDRLRQNDLHATGRVVVRFSYDAIRSETGRCVAQLQAVLRQDALLKGLLTQNPIVEQPDMDPDPLASLRPSPFARPPRGGGDSLSGYFDDVREKLNLGTFPQSQS